jgi:hypothetical protein
MMIGIGMPIIQSNAPLPILIRVSCYFSCERKAGAFPPAGRFVYCYLVVAGAEEGAAGGVVTVVDPEPVVSEARG